MAPCSIAPLVTGGPATHADGCDQLVNLWSNGGRVSTDEEHLAWLRRNAAARQAQDPVVDLAVEDAQTGEHVGIVGIQRGLPYLKPSEVNLTYTLYAGRRGRGHACAAVLEAMGLAMTRPPVERFLIRCDPANVRSAALARRLGFCHRGSFTEPDGWTGDRYEWNLVDSELPRPS